MEFSKLIADQIAADKRRGFQVDFVSEADQVTQLEMDLVGLMGEIGEFANVLKKVRLTIAHANYKGPALRDVTPELREELADALIYLIRLSTVLSGDLENDLIDKMKANDARYSPLE
ncbi:hypothetical protein OWM54_23795 [Myxococcus sp. MISCRS1]|uniref:MazG nucleotide pyrophosphohydrolase domain-containing protein n=1 Tax=Myxococcus sp. MISCRS1 TaxID=2996786 RepID=UPI00226F657B|nr:MazG nucleotide pyrophosphohydrolase domain-containing protein [Myxococcus sp. MISCRS1]MCY1000166.1 hypothetical protein [Myxococcus sp. MISCRS1]